MALTQELLKGNAATAGLSDDQIKAVVEMSANDENTVIAQKTSEIYSGLDADILSVSGIAKGTNEKTYDYAKRAIGEIKGQAGNAADGVFGMSGFHALLKDRFHHKRTFRSRERLIVPS